MFGISAIVGRAVGGGPVAQFDSKGKVGLFAWIFLGGEPQGFGAKGYGYGFGLARGTDRQSPFGMRTPCRL